MTTALSTDPAIAIDEINDWLFTQAAPLWSGAGIIPSSGISWEALNFDGSPCVEIPVRLRVQPRQAFSLARLARAGELPSGMDLPVRLLNWVYASGFDDAGHLGALTDADGNLLKVLHDLYDLAFVVLATAELIMAGEDRSADLVRIDAALDLLKAHKGWHETADHRQPRRQNPHMHLFEATTALFEATNDTKYRNMADECLSLFHDIYFQPDGILLEMFKQDWQPDDASQQIEPGHMAEWIWLLAEYERVTGQGSGADLDLLWSQVLRMRTSRGVLPDTSTPPSSTCRLWPQTEFLKAALVMFRRGDTRVKPRVALDQLWNDYIIAPVPGGWVDARDRDGAVTAKNMPASSLYHIVIALLAVTPADIS